MPGFPRRSISAASSRATRRPEIDVSGMAARHSRVTSSTTFRASHYAPLVQEQWRANRRPQASWSCTKSNDHRAFGRASTRIGARVSTASRRARRLRHRGAATRTDSGIRTGGVHCPDPAAVGATPSRAVVWTGSGSSCDPLQQGGRPAAPTGPSWPVDAQRLRASRGRHHAWTNGASMAHPTIF